MLCYFYELYSRLKEIRRRIADFVRPSPFNVEGTPLTAPERSLKQLATFVGINPGAWILAGLDSPIARLLQKLL